MKKDSWLSEITDMRYFQISVVISPNAGKSISPIHHTDYKVGIQESPPPMTLFSGGSKEENL
jgi:hypothetical protein